MTPGRALGAAGLLWLCWLLGCGPPLADPASGAAADGQLEVLDERLDPRRWLGAAAQQARQAGAGPLQPLAAEVTAEGDRLGGFVELSETDCLLGLARPSAGISDVDLFVFSDGGDVLASDEAPTADASVLLCAPHPRRVYLAARVMSGRGVLALGAQQVPAAAAQSVGRAVKVRGGPGQDTGRLSAWPGLEAKLRARRQRLGSTWDDVRRAVLPVEPQAASTLSVPIGKDRCLDVLATPAAGVLHFELTAVDAAGRIIARGRSLDRDRALIVCSRHRTTVTLRLRPRVSTGLVAVVVGRSPRGVAHLLEPRSWVFGASALLPLSQAVARHRGRMKRLRWSRPRRAGRGQAPVGTPTTVSLNLGQGCSRVDVIGGEPAGPLAVQLWTKAGERVASAEGSEVATVFRCGAAASLHLEVQATTAPGPFEVEVRHDASAAAVLVRHGHAAGRLLGHLEATEGPVDTGRAAAAEALELTAQRRLALPVVVEPGQCALAAVSLGGDPRGVELRLSSDDGGLLSWQRGAAVAEIRHCVQSRFKGSLQLQVQRGRTGALLLRRIEPTVRPAAPSPQRR